MINNNLLLPKGDSPLDSSPLISNLDPLEGNFFFSLAQENIIKLLFNLADVLSIILPVLLSVAFMTIIERKQLAAHQRRVGPVKCFGETLILGKTIKLRGHPKDNSTKLSLKPE